MDDNYDDGPPQGQSPQPASQDAGGEDEAQGKTCLLPASAFPGAKPGDSLSVEVVAVHGDEIEVKPDNDDQDGGDPDDSGDQSQQQAPAAPDPSGGGSMDSMMQ